MFKRAGLRGAYPQPTPAAWDRLPTEGVAQAAADADAIVFGTLSQREGGNGVRVGTTRDAVAAARCEGIKAGTLIVCDVNLRAPFTDESVVARSAFGVDLLKLNDEELLPVSRARASLRASTEGMVRGANDG